MVLNLKRLGWSDRSILAAVLFCMLAASSAFAAKKESVPDWVRSAAAHPIQATYSAETKAVVLLEEITYRVEPDGQATEHVRHVVKILRAAGRDEGNVYVHFDKDTSVLSLHVWSIGPDGHEYAVQDSEVVEFGYPGQGNLYQDDKFKAVRAPGRDPGGVIAYEYEQKVRPYLKEKTWFFQGNLPSVSQSFTLELPAGFSYGTVWAHHTAQKATDLERQRWRWEMRDTPAIDLEHVVMHPSELALAGRMTIHYGVTGTPEASAGTWQGIGQWYRGLSSGRLDSTPDIALKANELIAGKADFYDRTEAIGEFVQKQVRYFVIEMGIGGYQPHFASDIFRNRYGDCKDKATLLSAMLSSVGIHAALMMVDHRRGVIDPDAPSIVGDHMIAAIEIPKGYDSPRLRSVITSNTGRRYLIFDPTWEKTAFGQLEHNLQGGYGVLMEGEASQIVELPLLAPELNTVHRTASFHLQPDGSLKGTVTERRFGDLSEEGRTLYTTGDAKEQRDYLDHVLERDFTTFQVSGVKVENAESLNKELTTTFRVAADRFGKTMGPLLMVRPRVLGSEYVEADHKPRSVPINLRETLQARDEYEIELPQGYSVDELPPGMKVDVGFASYESSTKVKDNVLYYSRTYTVRAVTLPPEKYDDLQRLSGMIAADEQNQAVLKKQ